MPTADDLHALPARRLLPRLPILDEILCSDPGPHPRVLVTPDDIPGLREKVRHPEMARLWEAVRADADAALEEPPVPWDDIPKGIDDHPWVNLTEPRPSLEFTRNSGDALFNYGFAYLITGDERYARRTIDQLLNFATWPDWGDAGHDELGLGQIHILAGCGTAYDWVYDRMSDGERDRVRHVILREANRLWQAFGEDGRWFARAPLQNHMWWRTCGLGLTALALEGEVDAAEHWLNDVCYAVQVITETTERMSDGSWPEGMTYQTYGFNALTPLLYAVRKGKGVELISDDNLYFRNFARFRTYNLLMADPTALFLTYADVSSTHSSATTAALRFCADRFGDGFAEWAARRIASQRRRGRVRDPVFEILFFNPHIEPIAPTEWAPDIRLTDLEGVIWRSGWDEEALVFGLKCGPYGGRSGYDRQKAGLPPFNRQERADWGDVRPEVQISLGHHHEDAGTFWIYKGATALTREAFGSNVRDVTYSLTSLHNAILIDGAESTQRTRGPKNAEPFNADAGIVRCDHGDRFNYLVADATGRYNRPPNPLKEHLRHVLWVKPAYFLIADRLVAHEPHDYDWVCHFTGGSQVEGDWIKGIADGDARLGVHVIRPADFTTTEGTHTVEWAISWRRVRPVEQTAALRFVTLLWPTTESAWDRKPTVEVARENHDGIELTVRLPNGRTDRVDWGYGADGAVAVASE